MLRCVTAILLAFELFAATFIQIPAGLVQRAQLRSAYRDGIFSELPADSSNKDLSFSYVSPTLTSNRYVREIEDTSSVVYDDLILIANLAQLLAIGTDRAVTDTDLVETQFGEGEPVFYADGTQAVYASAASYYLCNDIPLPQGGVFALPEDFSGMFCGAPKAEETVYDPETDTVYIGSIYQLQALASAERETMPVVSGDLHPDTFGVGSLIFLPEEPEQHADGGEDPDAVIPEEDFVEVETGDSTEPTDPAADDPNAAIPEEDFVTVETGAPDPDGSAAADFASQQIELMPNGTEETDGSEDVRTEPNGTEQTDGAEEPTAPAYLTYSSSHNYVLSSAFTAERAYTPAMLLNAPPLRAPSDHVDGRDYFGQVSVVINGETYILIGDRQQLDAINDDATIRTKVCGPVFKATEGSVEVYRIGSSGLGDWIWLSEFDGSKTLMDGNGYGTTAAEVIASYQNLASGATVIYPGDADLIDLGADGDFSESPLYDKSSGSYHGLDRPGGTATSASSTREVYFTTNSSGVPDLSTATLIESAPTVGTLTYTKDGKYIVFRDIDMTKGALTSYGTQWKPLMFTGEMYGVKASTTNPTLWDSGHTAMNLDPDVKPVISNIAVTPVSVTVLENFQSVVRLDVGTQSGVGFFGTLTGKINGSDLVGTKCLVKNIKLYNGTVTNDLVKAAASESLINGLLTLVGDGLGLILDGLLSLLLQKEFKIRDTLTDCSIPERPIRLLLRPVRLRAV